MRVKNSLQTLRVKDLSNLYNLSLITYKKITYKKYSR